MSRDAEHLAQDALAYHERGRPGKLEVVPTVPLLTQRDLSLAYSPGVAAPCRAIAADPDAAFRYTARGNLVAVITNGTAVLGLGDIGPLAAKPVMEGKANLFKKFADIDVFDIELDARDPEAFIAAVKALAPTFGGINLEDIKAPEAFVIEERLRAELDIPVFHDDQHGTAIIASAALINALHLTGRAIGEVSVVFSGAGAAAIATARLFRSLGMAPEQIRMFDSRGLVHRGRTDRQGHPAWDYARDPGPLDLAEALRGADVFVGLSVGGVLTPEMLEGMAERPIVFAMANPDPEIPYAAARAARPDAIVATGRSDTPNQINNVLGFPYVFRGALDCRACCIDEAMQVAAVHAIARIARQDVPDTVLRAYDLEELRFGPEYIIPKPFDPRVLIEVAPAVAEAAARSGVARQPIEDLEAYRHRLETFVERSRDLLRPSMNRAAGSGCRIVFTEGSHPDVLRAARILVQERTCIPVLLGPAWRIAQRAGQLGIPLDGMEIREITPGPEFDALADRLWHLRRRRGFTRGRCRRLLRDPIHHGCMLVREGMADGLVGGLEQPYADTLRPALQVVGRAHPDAVVSGVYAMLWKDRRIFFGDCTVQIAPDAATLAGIAINTARVAQALGVRPKVAMLSWSDFGEHHRHPDVARVREALRIVRARWPDLEIDGELQADTATDPRRAAGLYPFSAIQGDANVLVFPDLASGNIAYKLLRTLGGATAVGPMLVGLARPVNALALASSVDDIVNIAALTVVEVLDARQGRPPWSQPGGVDRAAGR